MDEQAADTFVKAIATNWRTADLDAANHILCGYAEKLTTSPHQIGDEDIITLRRHGFDDVAIHDATQIVGYFNYINRVADALGVEHEEFVRLWEQP